MFLKCQNEVLQTELIVSKVRVPSKTTPILRHEAVGIIPSSPTILLVMSGCGECFKVAEHSFQVSMPNSPLLLNYL